MSVVGILIALGLLIWLAYRGWSILLLAPLCALIPALLAGQPLLASWTQTFMSNAAGFVAQFRSQRFALRRVAIDFEALAFHLLFQFLYLAAEGAVLFVQFSMDG